VFFHGPILLNFSLFEEGQIQPFWTAPQPHTLLILRIHTQ
jgi:hypothetical protein